MIPCSCTAEPPGHDVRSHNTYTRHTYEISRDINARKSDAVVGKKVKAPEVDGTKGREVNLIWESVKWVVLGFVCESSYIMSNIDTARR